MNDENPRRRNFPTTHKRGCQENETRLEKGNEATLETKRNTMKDARLGDFLLWKGEPARIVAETSNRQVIIEMIESCKCPHCQGDLGKYQFAVIVSSLLFQESAEPLQTIVSDPTLILSGQ